MLGVELRLLQMVWTSRQTPTLSASTTALLELATSMLSRMSASGRSAFTAAPTTNLCAAAGSASTNLRAAASAPAAHSGMLVLHQWPGRLHDAGRVSGQGRSMLSDTRRSGAVLQKSLLVLYQRARRADQHCRMQRVRRAMLSITRRSGQAL